MWKALTSALQCCPFYSHREWPGSHGDLTHLDQGSHPAQSHWPSSTGHWGCVWSRAGSLWGADAIAMGFWCARGALGGNGGQFSSGKALTGLASLVLCVHVLQKNASNKSSKPSGDRKRNPCLARVEELHLIILPEIQQNADFGIFFQGQIVWY